MKNNPVLDLALVRACGCQWLGDQTSECGSPDLVKDTVYCTHHYPMMHQKGSALRKRKKDIRTADQCRDLVSLFNEAVEELTNEGVI
jgi:hypothetical protein